MSALNKRVYSLEMADFSSMKYLGALDEMARTTVSGTWQESLRLMKEVEKRKMKRNVNLEQTRFLTMQELQMYLTEREVSRKSHLDKLENEKLGVINNIKDNGNDEESKKSQIETIKTEVINERNPTDDAMEREFCINFFIKYERDNTRHYERDNTRHYKGVKNED